MISAKAGTADATNAAAARAVAAVVMTMRRIVVLPCECGSRRVDCSVQVEPTRRPLTSLSPDSESPHNLQLSRSESSTTTAGGAGGSIRIVEYLS